MASQTVHGLLATVMLLALPAPLVAQTSAGPPRAWLVEVVGGVRGLSPDDLNAQVESDTAILDFLINAQVEQQHDGGLDDLARGYPFAVRVVRRLGPRWSVGGGFSFFTTERRSSAGASYAYTTIDPQAQEYVREFSQSLRVDPLVLTVRDYLPHGLVRYDIAAARRLRVGATLLVGWLVAECELADTLTTDGGFYPRYRQTDKAMTGRGGSLAADALVSLQMGLTSRFGLLVEGGYAWHRVPDVTGDHVTTLRVQDGEAAELELEQTSTATGRWVNQPVTVQTSGGPWQGFAPAIGREGSPFTLDLSGWQFSVGVSIGF